ncbi:MAG: FtsX-like permease family protein [Bdellovibrionales bacterium]|nr:FtsX-like permease family protein [Bdellovibrionales bacterium]
MRSKAPSPPKKRLWLATLLTGLLGFVLLTTLEENIRSALQSRSRELLGGDLALSSRRWLEPTELDLVRKELQKYGSFRETEALEFYSMVSTVGKTPQLVELIATDEAYPLVGELKRNHPDCDSCAWTDEALEIRWGLRASQSQIQIGNSSFTWAGRILKDTSRSLRGSSFAPRAFISRSKLAATGLLRSGATVYVRHLFAFEIKPSAETLDRILAELDQKLTDPGVQLKVPSDASDDEGRLLRNVSDYLGLASLVGLLLSFFGCAWLLRREITQQARIWAIYRTLSPQGWKADWIFYRLAFRVSFTASVAALLMAQGTWSALGPRISQALFMQDLMPTSLTLRTVLLTLGASLGTSAFALWPALRFLKRQPLSELLKNPEALAQKGDLRFSEILVFIFGVFLFSRGISHSWRVSGVFLGTLLVSSAALVFLGWVFLRLVEKFQSRSESALTRWSLLSISRVKSSSLVVWLTLALSSLLLSLMPLLEGSIRSQIQDPRQVGSIPSLFLFDIQEEQLPDLKKWASETGADLQFVTPLIRGRIVRVNGSTFEKASRVYSTREEEREARFRNRGINITIRDQLTASEKIHSGKPFADLSHTPEAPLERISVERRYAERLGLGLGDILDFEIQGVPISGKIVNLRQVQWTSFQPNFFITFGSGGLNDAPKTFLASLPLASAEVRERWQADLFDRFPNISSIDVTRLMESLLDGFSQISTALRAMALLTGLSGFAAVFSVLRLRARGRRSELELLKIMGADPKQLSRAITVETAALAFAASICGLILSAGVSAMLSVTLFEAPIVYPPLSWLMGLPASFAVFGGLLGRIACRDLISSQPQEWLAQVSEATH